MRLALTIFALWLVLSVPASLFFAALLGGKHEH